MSKKNKYNQYGGPVNMDDNSSNTEEESTIMAEEQLPETPVEKTIPTVETAVPRTMSAVNAFNKKAHDYIELAKTGLKSPEVRQKAVSILTNMALEVLASRDPHVFDACLAFILKNQSIMMSAQTIMRDLVPYGDKKKFTKVVQFYVIFQSLAEASLLKTKFTLNITTIRDLFNNAHLANWLKARC